MSRGSIVKRGNSYGIVISLGFDAASGRYKQQWVSGFKTKKEAQTRLTELLHQLDNGTFIKPGKTTLGEFLERWLRDYAWPNLAPRTAEGYESIISRHVVPSLGKMALTQLKPEHIQKYYSDKLSGGLSAQTVRHHHTTLHKALQTALEWGLVQKNAADAVRPPRVQHTEMQTWDEDDMATFLGAAKQTPYFALFYLLLFTGARRSELLGLRWSDVDLLLCRVHVTRSLHVLKGGKVAFRSPKSTKGRRMIALSPSAVAVLRRHKEAQDERRTTIGAPLGDDDLVFCHLDGRSLLPNSVTHAWIKLVRRTGVKRIRLHDARHTHASLLLKQGAHPKIVQERLGHSSIQITLDTYSHIAPGLQEAAADRFDQAFAARYNGRGKEAVENNY